MAQYRDIDLPSGVSLRINGELNLPSNSITLTTGNVNSNQVILGSQATATNQAVRADRQLVFGAGIYGTSANLTSDVNIAVAFAGTGGNYGNSNDVSRSDHNHDTIYVLTTGNSLIQNGALSISGGTLKLNNTAGVTSYMNIIGYGGYSYYLYPDSGTSNEIRIGDSFNDDRSFSIKYTPNTTGSGNGVLQIGQIWKNSATYTHGQTSLYTNGIEALRIDNGQNVTSFGTGNFTFYGTPVISNGNDIWFGGSRRPSIYTTGTNQALQIRSSSATAQLQLNYDNGGPVVTQHVTVDDGNGNMILTNSNNANPSPYLAIQNNTSIGSNPGSGRITVYHDSSDPYSGKLSLEPWYYNGSQYTWLTSAFVVGADKSVKSLNNTLDNGNGSMIISGIIQSDGGFGYNTSDMSKAPMFINGNVNGNTAILGNSNPIIILQNYPGIGFNTYYNGSGYSPFTASSYTGIISLNSSTGDYSFYTGTNPSSGNINITERMRITNGGNVGIGVTNPLYTLHTQVIAIDSYDSQLRQGYSTGNGKLNRSIGGAYGWDSNMLYINGFGDWASGVSVGSAPNNTSVNLTVTGALTANSTANILGNMTIGGSLYLGPSNGAGTAVVRNGTGANAIQLDGGMAGKLSGVNSYIDGNGNAQFAQTISANALIINSQTMVTNLNAQYLSGNPVTAFVQNATNVDMGGYGVISGLSVSQLSPSPSNTTVTLSSGVVYTYSGMRVSIPTQNIVTAVNSNTSDRIDLVYIKGPSANLLEGNIGIIQGAYGSPPTAPTCPNDGVPIAQLYMRASSATIQNSNITDVRQWKPIRYDSNYGLVVSTLACDILHPNSNNTIYSSVPFRGSFAKSFTFTSGTTSQTWTHNFNLLTYAITFSLNTAERHVYWSSKSSNSIVINIDDIDQDEIVTVDALITAY